MLSVLAGPLGHCTWARHAFVHHVTPCCWASLALEPAWMTRGADVQGAYPVFQQTDVKRAFNVACAAFQGRFLGNGESVLVRDGVLLCSAASVRKRGPGMAPNCCLAGRVA